MRLTVLFFGVLQERFGRQEELTLFPGHSVSDLLHYYRAISPELQPVWDTLAVAVNQQYSAAGTALRDGDEVALLPPVSGGLSVPAAERPVWLTGERIDAEAVVASLKAGADGAVVVFDGVVRDNTRGRPTLYLEYSAYESMALEQMRALAAQAVERFGVRDVALLHRLGRLEIGETSVLIAVASPHRAAAFEACRWLIDSLKQTVPIWKREVFVDGAVWAPGEPFPAALGASGGRSGDRAVAAGSTAN